MKNLILCSLVVLASSFSLAETVVPKSAFEAAAAAKASAEAVVAQASPEGAAAKPSNDVLEGKWLGYCSPKADATGSKMCNYTFKKDGSGAYQCDFFTDRRCTTKDAKSLSAPFRFNVSSGDSKGGRVKIEFANREDVKEERIRYFIAGDILRFQIYEFLRLPAESKEKKVDNLEAQGIVPFYEYSRENSHPR